LAEEPVGVSVDPARSSRGPTTSAACPPVATAGGAGRSAPAQRGRGTPACSW
jgi:hypothetical protein